MADVFISYANADRSLALKLAAMLEAEGWKVWWDTSLTIGDDFRNEIMTELGRARAVIVIWTDASIKSDWVRSEAGRAQGPSLRSPWPRSTRGLAPTGLRSFHHHWLNRNGYSISNAG